MYKVNESYSQYHEDVILWACYSALSRTGQGCFVDIGANDGKSWSNSYFFGQLGWRMLLVEPLPTRAGYCRNLYAGNSAVMVEQKAISASTGIVDFYVTTDAERDLLEMGSSLSQETVPFGLASKATKVESCPLFSLLEKHRWPSEYAILSVDAEGFDLQVLETAGFDRWSPLLICVEQTDASAVAIADYLSGWGYEQVAATLPNGIYAKSKSL
jgi:FkbM family methyltransferase